MAEEKEYVINRSLDSIMESLPIGSIQRAISNNLYGINFRQSGNPVPRVKDTYGFIFFTRPQLNLSTLNITNYRGFYNLLTQNRISYQAYTRGILDPRLGFFQNSHNCPFIDRQNPFISVLTNNCLSSSGWPDIMAPTYSTEAGTYGQQHSHVDGVTNHFESYDLDFVFKNTKGNPLLYFFYIWVKYATLVYEGILNPYLDMIAENEIDYSSRVYRIVLDQQKRYVTQIGCTGAGFPVNVPTGNLFDFNSDAPYNTRNGELSIRFRNDGFLAFEDIIKFWFNSAVAIFNPSMRVILQHDIDGSSYDDNVTREDPMTVYSVGPSEYVKIPYALAAAADMDGINNRYLSLNHKAVPFINLHTNELEWWVPKSIFNGQIQNGFSQHVLDSGLGSDTELVD